MPKFDSGDIVTIYFVVTHGTSRTGIQAWTFEKTLADFYMEFHKCKHFKLKSMKGTIEEMYKITEENIHDEIAIYNLWTHDPKDPTSDKPVTIPVPMTGTEYQHVNGECQSFMQNDIDYSLLSQGMDYMEPEYQKLLARTGLTDIIRYVIHNKQSKFVEGLQMDQLMVFARSFPDCFGD